MGLAGDWSVEVNQASPITTSSPEILTRNGLVPPFQCHHSSSPRRGVSLQNTTPQQQQQKTRTTTRFPLLFVPVNAKNARREREREIRKPTKPTTQKQNPNPVQEQTFQVLYTTNNSQSSTQPGLWRRWVLLLWRVSRGREGGSTFWQQSRLLRAPTSCSLPDSSIFVCSAATWVSEWQSLPLHLLCFFFFYFGFWFCFWFFLYSASDSFTFCFCFFFWFFYFLLLILFIFCFWFFYLLLLLLLLILLLSASDSSSDSFTFCFWVFFWWFFIAFWFWFFFWFFLYSAFDPWYFVNHHLQAPIIITVDSFIQSNRNIHIGEIFFSGWLPLWVPTS